MPSTERNLRVVIPARLRSKRLHEKPLIDLGGTPMIVRVYMAVQQGLGDRDIVVAVDDDRVMAVLNEHRIPSVMTDPACVSGTDRTAQVARIRAWSQDDIVINVQGDEPLVPADLLAAFADFCSERDEISMATVAAPITELREVADPNVVKIALRADGSAITFSRSPMPFDRDRDSSCWHLANYRRHVGVYGYRNSTLQCLASRPECPLERIERLEQLRAVWLNIPIHVMDWAFSPPLGVDTAADVERVSSYFIDRKSPRSRILSPRRVIDSARRVFELEAESVKALGDRLTCDFERAVQHLLASRGRAIVCGMGKSGTIARKISATLASTGTPSFFMHPAEAYHGDLGMVTPQDSFIAISNSGETEEVLKLLPFLKENGNFLIAATGNAGSALAAAADCHLDVAVSREACPLQLSPMASTTAALAMGDALAVALMEARDFKPEQFARFHPGGSLGRRLLRKVEHEMISGDLPILDQDAKIMTVLRAITDSSLGLVVIRVGSEWAVITDGDLRRGIERFGASFFERTAVDLMTRDPVRVPVGTRMEDALAKMERNHITRLLVFDGDSLVGIVKK